MHYSNELQLAENKIAKLKSAPLLDQELAFQIGLLEVEYSSQCDNLSAAFGIVAMLNAQCEKYSADVYYRIKLLVTKATLFAEGDSAEKGLSLAVRAVMSAYQTRAISLLCEACNALATVLITLEHFAAARGILVAVIYQVCRPPYLHVVSPIADISRQWKMTIVLSMHDYKPQWSMPRLAWLAHLLRPILAESIYFRALSSGPTVRKIVGTSR